MSKLQNEKLEKIYKKLPTINCKQLCDVSCGMIPVGELETKRITEWLGYNPFLNAKEIIQKLEANPNECELTCSLLKEGKCTIYKIRPLVCRLFGLVKKMKCPFGCIPSKWLDDEVAKKMLIKAKYY